MGACLAFLTVVPGLPPNSLDLDWNCSVRNHRHWFAFFLFLLVPAGLSWGYSLMGRPFRGDTETLSWVRLSSKVIQPGSRHWVTPVSLFLLWVTVTVNPLCDVIFWKHEGGLSWGTHIAHPFRALTSMDETVCKPFSWGWWVIKSYLSRPQKQDCLLKVVLDQLCRTFRWIPLVGVWHLTQMQLCEWINSQKKPALLLLRCSVRNLSPAALRDVGIFFTCLMLCPQEMQTPVLSGNTSSSR